jgi:truncated hemoglobin YjbI
MEIGCVDGVHPSLQNLCFKLLAFLSALARRKETLNFSGNRMRNRILWRSLAQPDFKAWAKLFQVGVNKFPWLETSLVPTIPCVLFFVHRLEP